MSIQIVRPARAREITGLPKSTLTDLESKGLFPKRVRLSARASGYYLHELEEWMKNRPRAEEAAIKMPSRRLAGNPHADKRCPD